MMYVYMVAIVVLTVVIIGFFYMRAQQAQAQAGMSARQKRYQVHEHAVLELNQAKERGDLDAEAYSWELEQLNKRLVDEMTGLVEEKASADSAPGIAKSKTNKPLAYGLFLVPLLAAGLYFFLGQPLPDPARALQKTGDVGQFLDQIQGLEAKVAADPDNTAQQLMLARSYRVMGRYPESVVAYGKAWPLVEKDPSELALFAEVLALQRGSFEGKPDELLAQAKALDANNLDVMMLLGQSAIQQKRYEEALAVLLPLKRELDASGEETDWLQSQIESIEQQLN